MTLEDVAQLEAPLKEQGLRLEDLRKLRDDMTAMILSTEKAMRSVKRKCGKMRKMLVLSQTLDQIRQGITTKKEQQ